MNKIEKEYQQIHNDNCWDIVYQRITRQCDNLMFTCTEAERPENRRLNRYRDVKPFDHSRIILKRLTNNYINANLVQVPRANKLYILTQGPLAVTVSHFWCMVTEQKSSKIIMLNKLIEKGEEKCYCYWPHDIGEDNKMIFQDVQIEIELLSVDENELYKVRKIRVHDLLNNSTQDVIQFQYMSWPDFGVPDSPMAFLKFLNCVRNSDVRNQTSGPVILHCSAGIGRSGTFSLVDACLAIIERDGPDNINIQDILLQIRNYRTGLIQTPDQLKFSYEAILQGVRLFQLQSNNLLGQSAPDNSIENSNDSPIYKDVKYLEVPSVDIPPTPPPRIESRLRQGCVVEKNPITSYRTDSEESESEEPPKTPAPFEGYEISYLAETNNSAVRDNLHEVLQRRNLIQERLNVIEKEFLVNQEKKTKYFNYKFISMSFGVLVAGIFAYSYLRH